MERKVCLILKILNSLFNHNTQLGNWKNRLGLFAILFLITSLIIVPFSSSPTFAKHIDPAGEELENYEGYEPLRVYVIYAAYYRECNYFDESKDQFFKMLIHQYLRMSGFLPITTSGIDCVKVTGSYEKTSGDPTQGLTLDDTIKKAEDFHFDLLVIVLDTPLSYQSYFKTYKDGGFIAGHYSPKGS